MKFEEKVAETYLNSLGFGVAKYEPDGNIPPDFSLPNSTAIEVRRLNKQIEVSGERQGLEQAEIPLMKVAEATLQKFDGVASPNSYLTFLYFSRPLPDKRLLASKLESVLTAFLRNPLPVAQKVFVDPALSIAFFSTAPIPNRCFVVAGNSDADRGGWVVDDYRENIQLCSDEKMSKTAPYRAKYSQWWLLLVDFIGFGLDNFDRDQLKKTPTFAHNWDKIVLVNPSDPTRTFEI